MTESSPIAFYVPSLTVGGAERVTVTVANGLADRGYAVDLLVPYYEGSFVEEVSDDVTVFDLETPRVPGVGVGASVPRLVSYLRRRSPAVVFSQMTYTSSVCLLAHWLAGSDAVVVPVVHNTLGIDESPKDRVARWLGALAGRRADRFAAVSEGAAESVVDRLHVDAEEVSVLHNPIPVSEVRERSRQPVDHPWVASDEHDVVLGVGRLDSQKDFPTFLRAFRRVHERRPETRAVIVGRGPERETLETLAGELGTEEVVSFAGYVDNPYGYMAGADVLTMSSVHEGLPTVLIEALACGCPVVSTDCPSGPRTILDDGRYGPLVPVGDERALADATLRTLREPPERSALVDRARDFAPDTVLDRYESFIRMYGPFLAAVESGTETEPPPPS